MLQPTAVPNIFLDVDILKPDQRCTVRNNVKDPSGYLGNYLTQPGPSHAHRVPRSWTAERIEAFRVETMDAYRTVNASTPKGKIVFAGCLERGTGNGEVRVIAVLPTDIKPHDSPATIDRMARRFAALLSKSTAWDVHPCILSGADMDDFEVLLNRVIAMLYAKYGPGQMAQRTTAAPASPVLQASFATAVKVPSDPLRTIQLSHQDGEADVLDQPLLIEGKESMVEVKRRERSRAARQLCIAHHGAVCSVCGMDFGKVFGRRGEGYCHVHHLDPIHATQKERPVDPIKDLAPVCPNCHAMLHTEDPPLSIQALKKELEERGWRWSRPGD